MDDVGSCVAHGASTSAGGDGANSAPLEQRAARYAATGSGGGGGDDAGGRSKVIGVHALPRLVNGWARHPTVLERYYETHTTSNHQCLHVHSNGICVLNVSPSHPMLQPPLTITGIAMRSHDSKNLMQTAVRGKKKAGAVFILPRDMVCTVSVSDGSTVTLYGCVRASVVEVNQRLLDNPALLGTPEGYIAVLMPKQDEKKSIREACEEFDRECVDPALQHTHPPPREACARRSLSRTRTALSHTHRALAHAPRSRSRIFSDSTRSVAAETR